MISVSTSLFATGPGVMKITRSTPLSNAFKLGDTNVLSRNVITDGEGMAEAYAHWLGYQIRLHNRIVVQALDEIAYRELDGDDTILICPCGRPTCHGYIIKDVVETKLRELNQ